VKSWPGVEERLGGPEKLLHQQQPLILHRHFGRGQIGVNAQDVFAVKAGLVLDRGLIDAHWAPLHLQEQPKTTVAHQAHGALVQLIRERRQHRLPVRRVLGGLLGIVADHVTPPLHPHLLDPEVVRHCEWTCNRGPLVVTEKGPTWLKKITLGISVVTD